MPHAMQAGSTLRPAGDRRRAGLLDYYLAITIIVTGAEILAVEIVGVRLISPQFGVSLYVWSALISVTLLALAVGYALGGLLADRRSSPGDVFLIVVIAAAALAIIPFIASPVFSLTAHLGLRLGTLCSALLLFMVPLSCLAMVTPYVVRLIAGIDPGRAGRFGTITGIVYALSTIGSVVGALVTGFLLVPNYPLHHILNLLAAGLVVIAVVFWIASRAIRAVVALGLCVMAGVALQSTAPPLMAQLDSRFRQLVQIESLYGELRVVERDAIRFLLLNGIVHTGIDADGVSVFPYSHVMERLLWRAVPEARNILVIGLGGGVIPRSLRSHPPPAEATRPVRVDVVEIDPVVEQLARAFFDYERQEAVFIEDGRRYLMQTLQRYDAIIIDVYASESLPFHLFSLEAFTLMKERLTPEGVVLINYLDLSRLAPSRARQSLTATLGEVFSNVAVYTIVTGGSMESQIFVAGRPRQSQGAEAVTVTLTSGPYRDRAITARPAPLDTSSGLLLTDAFNPIDLLDVAAVEEMRRANRRYLSPASS